MLFLKFRPARQLSTNTHHVSAALGQPMPPAMSRMLQLLLTCAQSFAHSGINNRHPHSHTKHVHFQQLTCSPASMRFLIVCCCLYCCHSESFTDARAQLSHISHVTRPLGNSNEKKKYIWLHCRGKDADWKIAGGLYFECMKLLLFGQDNQI